MIAKFLNLGDMGVYSGNLTFTEAEGWRVTEISPPVHYDSYFGQEIDIVFNNIEWIIREDKSFVDTQPHLDAVLFSPELVKKILGSDNFTKLVGWKQ